MQLCLWFVCGVSCEAVCFVCLYVCVIMCECFVVYTCAILFVMFCVELYGLLACALLFVCGVVLTCVWFLCDV